MKRYGVNVPVGVTTKVGALAASILGIVGVLTQVLTDVPDVDNALNAGKWLGFALILGRCLQACAQVLAKSSDDNEDFSDIEAGHVPTPGTTEPAPDEDELTERFPASAPIDDPTSIPEDLGEKR